MEPSGVNYALNNSTELLISFTVWLLYRRMTLCQISGEPKMYGWSRGVRERNRQEQRVRTARLQWAQGISCASLLAFKCFEFGGQADG